MLPPPHVPHPVVPEVTMELCKPRVASQDPSKQGSMLSASVVAGQGQPVPGILFSLPTTPITITTDASMEGWGRHDRLPWSTMALYSGIWSTSECRLHINVLELREVCLTLFFLEQEIVGQTVFIESDNTATVSYINKQGGVVSKTFNDKVCTMYEWAIPRSLKLRAVHQPGVKNKLADYLSQNCPDPTEWHLTPLIAQRLFEMWGRPQVDLFPSH